MLKNIYSQKLTILNKLRRADSNTNKDEWFKHTVLDGVWYTDEKKGVIPNGIVIGTYIRVFIPFHSEYLEYDEWKANTTDYYTMSVGDYIVLGDVSEGVNASNIVATMQKYQGKVCQVKSCRVCHNRFLATVQLKIEGV